MLFKEPGPFRQGRGDVVCGALLKSTSVVQQPSGCSRRLSFIWNALACRKFYEHKYIPSIFVVTWINLCICVRLCINQESGRIHAKHAA